MSATKPLCNLDCFNCRFVDCVNDRLEMEDYKSAEKMDKNIIEHRDGEKTRKLSQFALMRKKEYHSENRDNKKAYSRAYYDLNRERFEKYRLLNRQRKSAYDREYFLRNREKIKKKHKIYGQKNKEYLRERQKEWREKNRDRIKEYQRQYYLRKKEEIK